MDLNKQEFSLDYADKKLVLEASDLAPQATASMIGHYGNTSILVAIVMSNKDKSSNYFPLSINFEERFYARGKILGSRFMRREGRPSDEAVLTGRILDRVIRPLFNHRIRRDVQVIVTVLSFDPEDDINFLTLMTTSAALASSKIPWNGPVAGVSIVSQGGNYEINPNTSSISEDFEYISFVAGTDEKINMIELEGKEAKEESIMKGFELAQVEIKKLIAFQNDVINKIGKEKEDVSYDRFEEDLVNKIISFIKPKMEPAIYIKDKTEREIELKKIDSELDEYLVTLNVNPDDHRDAIYYVLEEFIDKVVHDNILSTGKRPDGRKPEEIRELLAQVGLLKQTHGSGLFIRGKTQALAVATIGAPGDEKIIENMLISYKDRFMLHYNFPQYSVGETGPFRGPGRREIGHGALAKKAIKNMLPSKEEVPYTIRVVSEILSSNGSSSMATVCATTLSLMDAGVPIKKPIAGIAMGLITGQDGNYKILTDIQGYEDHYGDADLKVAGSTDGVTAMQMDVKIEGMNLEMLKEELEAAKTARLQILDVITKAIPAPRTELSEKAPLILTIKVKPDQIGTIIGSGGKTINGIIEKTGATSIDIDDDGMVYISGDNKEAAQAALKEVESLVKEFVIGEVLEGEVVKILEFGAIVKLDENNDGMVHVSELADGFVKSVGDVVKLGDKVKVKVVKVEHGKIGLSIKKNGEQKT